MVNVSGLTNFFSSTYNLDAQEYDAQPGYQLGSLDILLQRARRSKYVTEAKIWDYILVENDPNFGRSSKSVSNKLNKFISKLGMSSSIMTVFNSQIFMANIHEFFPSNITDLLFNYQSLIDTNINILNSLDKQIVFRQIEQVFFKDFELEFLGEKISFNEIVNSLDSLIENFPLADSIENNGLRPLLSLGLQNFLPEEFLSVFDSLQYLDLLETIFINDEANSLLFDGALKNSINSLMGKEVDYYLTSDYSNVQITYSDPLGIQTRESFKQEIITNYMNEFEVALRIVSPQYGISEEQIDQIVSLFGIHVADQVNISTKGSIGLPSLVLSSNAVSNLAQNDTIDAIKRGLENLINKIIKDNGIAPTPKNTRPADYLQNVKRNIEARLQFSKRGANTEQFVEIEKYLSSVLPGIPLNERDLTDLNNRLDILLKTKDVSI